jgi:tetratricopeptide (TPR) repeat protein
MIPGPRPFMLELARKTGLCAIAALCVTGGAAASGAKLEGAYYGQLGHVRFTTDARGHVEGRYGLGGPCAFDAGRPVVDGSLEGNVLVGSVTLCQAGPACEERTYPFLGFVTVDDGAVVADVKLDPGCDSPGLQRKRLVLEVARPENGQSALGPDGKVTLAALKKRPLAKKAQQKQCDADFQRAVGLMPRNDFAGAVHYFEAALACGEQVVLYQGIGVAQLNRDVPDAAMAALEKARDLAARTGQEDPQIHYNLACAYVRLGDKASAIKSLQRAVALGFADPTQLATDRDLATLRDEPEFKKVVDTAWSLKDRQRGKEGTR